MCIVQHMLRRVILHILPPAALQLSQGPSAAQFQEALAAADDSGAVEAALRELGSEGADGREGEGGEACLEVEVGILWRIP